MQNCLQTYYYYYYFFFSVDSIDGKDLTRLEEINTMFVLSVISHYCIYHTGP